MTAPGYPITATLLASICLCAVLVPGPIPLRARASPDRQTLDDFVPLFDGTLRGWTVENTDAGNFSVRDGVLHVEGPSGWLRSDARYLDFVLRVEFRFLTPDADSGVFVRAAGDGTFARGWPNRAYQVQLRVPSTPSPLPPVGGLFRHGMPPGETTFDPPLVEKTFGGVGAWQVVEIEVAGETLAVRFNGIPVTRASNVAPTPGFVGLQGETGAVEYRRIEILER
jgi:hypothetical protein